MTTKHLPFHSVVLRILVLAFFLIVIWASFYKIDEVTRATGTVIVTSRVQVIQSVDGGVIANLMVKEGDVVHKGQILATLEQTKVKAAVNELDARLAALQAQADRLRAEVLGADSIQFDSSMKAFPDIVEVQQALFKQRKSGFMEELRTLQVAVKLAQEDAQLIHKLAASGDVSRSEVIRVERGLNDAEAQLANRKNKFYQDARTELAKVEDDLAQNKEVRRQRVQQLDDTIFRAMVPGIVKNVRVTTKGGVLRAGEEFMQIVPLDDKLLIEAKVKPSDIARIREGLNANIRFDAFDYTIFGAVKGSVKYVSADTLKEDSKAGEISYYRVHIMTQSSPVKTESGKALDIKPGMTAQVDIRTGERTVLNYLLKPIRKTLIESFGER